LFIESGPKSVFGPLFIVRPVFGPYLIIGPEVTLEGNVEMKISKWKGKPLSQTILPQCGFSHFNSFILRKSLVDVMCDESNPICFSQMEGNSQQV